MGDINNLKVEPHVKLQIGSNGVTTQGGDGGSVFLFSERIRGSGRITADGGNGLKGGKGGGIRIITDDNQYKGEISAKGGEGRK